MYLIFNSISWSVRVRSWVKSAAMVKLESYQLLWPIFSPISAGVFAPESRQLFYLHNPHRRILDIIWSDIYRHAGPPHPATPKKLYVDHCLGCPIDPRMWGGKNWISKVIIIKIKMKLKRTPLRVSVLLCIAINRKLGTIYLLKCYLFKSRVCPDIKSYWFRYAGIKCKNLYTVYFVNLK